MNHPTMPPVTDRDESAVAVELSRQPQTTTTLRDRQPAQQAAASPPPRLTQVASGKPSHASGAPVREAAKREPKILIVDDEEATVEMVKAYLQREGYKHFLATVDPRTALDLIQQHQPDVILLDVKMPHISGLDILRGMRLDAALRHIPVLILTASTDPSTKQACLDLGASDFLAKPVDPHDLLPRVRNALALKVHIDKLSTQNERLEMLVKRRTEDLFNSRQQLILSLARAAEHRDDDTGNHVIRVGRYAGIIARQLGWPEARAQMLEQAAQLHDVGKIGIPDAILFKPGKLDPDEWELMRKHCAMGRDIIEPVSEKELGALRAHTRLGAEILHVRSSPMMMMATRIAQTHHERWDGEGYPLGLAGEDIPIEGRITAVADVFDALSSERSYKPAFPREKCFKILTEGRGAHFDPEVLDAFFARSEQIIQVQMTLMDRVS